MTLIDVRGLIHRLDIALWRLPRPWRRVLVLPIALAFAAHDFTTEAWGHGIPAARNAWRFVFDHVEERPVVLCSDCGEHIAPDDARAPDGRLICGNCAMSYVGKYGDDKQ
jgi:hypothetical protein